MVEAVLSLAKRGEVGEWSCYYAIFLRGGFYFVRVFLFNCFFLFLFLRFFFFCGFDGLLFKKLVKLSVFIEGILCCPFVGLNQVYKFSK